MDDSGACACGLDWVVKDLLFDRDVLRVLRALRNVFAYVVCSLLRLLTADPTLSGSIRHKCLHSYDGVDSMETPSSAED